jgi:hypothetical protein
VRLEGLGQSKTPVTSSRIETGQILNDDLESFKSILPELARRD